MTEYNAGEARLRIVPDASGFKRKLEEEIRRINAELPVDANTRKATEQIDRFRAEQRGRDVNVTVDVDTRKATAQMAALRQELDKFSAGSLGVGRSLKDTFTLAGAAAFAAFNPAVITGLADVAAGLQQVSQAGLAVPGAIGGAAASLGTLKLGFSGMGDAITAATKAASGSAKDVQAYNDALAKLSPNAADTVRAISDLTPAFNDIKNSVSGAMFDGIGASMRQLVAAEFPTFRKGLTGIAQAWNTDFKQLGLTLGDGKSQSIFDRLFGNTADAQTRVSKAIDPLVHGIGTLVSASSDSLPRLADGLGKVADRFDQFIESADKDGRLAEWIDKGLTGTTKLGESVLNIGKAFTAITKAAGGGDGFLGGLERITGKMQEFLNSDAGQDKLKRMFKAGHDELEQLQPIIANLAKILPGMFDAAQNSTNIWLPMLRTVTDILAQDPALVEAVTQAFIAWKTVDGINSLLNTLGLVKTELAVGVPGAAAKGATGISAALAGVAVPAWLAFMVASNADNIENWIKDKTGLPTGKDVYSQAQAYNQVLLQQQGLDTSGMPGLAPDNGPAPGASAQRRGVGPSGQVGGGGGFSTGGPVSGPGSGTSDSILARVSDGEFVVNAAATAQHRGLLEHINGYAGGGLVTPDGNPGTPGMAPGPSTPAPLQTGMNSMVQAALGPIGGGLLGGPIGNFVNMLNAPAPDPSTQTVSQQMGMTGKTAFGTPEGNFMNAASTLPGLWGALASMNSPDPAGNMMNWGTNTVGWLSNFASNTMSSFGSSLLDGALGSVGLQQSILSPNNPWTGAALQGANFALGGSGPIAGLMNSKGGGGSSGGGSTSLAGSIGGSGGGFGNDGSMMPGWFVGVGGKGGAGGTLVPGQWSQIDQIAKSRFGLNMTSGYRSANGPTIAGVAAAKSYHASGRAHDFSDGRRTTQEMAFAQFMAANYGPQLKELIFDMPGFNSTIHDGKVVGPFGSFYTLAQAGDHSDHVHVAYDTGGWLPPGKTSVVNNTGKPELVVNPVGQQKLADKGVNPSSLLGSGAPGQPPSNAPTNPADTAGKLLENVKLPTIGAAPASQDHNNPAISKGISAGASAIGSLVSSAIGAAGMAATMGGGAGAGAGGALASTAIQMGGQFLNGAINLGSSLLVGSVPGSYGSSQDRAYGKQVHTPPTGPTQPPASATTWNVNGVSDISRLIQEVDLRDAQHRAGLAKWGG